MQLLPLLAPGEGFVQHDACHPGRKPRALLELVQVREGVEVRLLHDVFDFGLVVDDRPRRAIELLVVPAHEDLEQRPLAGENTTDDFCIR